MVHHDTSSPIPSQRESFSVLLAVLLVTGGGVYAVHRHQVTKSAAAAKEAGFQALDTGDLTAAATHLGHYCSFAPEDLDAREVYAQLLLDGWDQKKKAYELREHILQKDPARDAVRVLQVHLALEIDRAIDARAHLDILLNKTPEDAELIYLRGRCAESDSEFEAAIDEYRNAIEAGPFHTPAHEHLAWLLERELKRPEEASEVIRHLEAGGRRDVDTLRVLAEFHLHRRQFESAEKFARAAIEQKPDDVRLLAKLAPIAEQHADVIARRGELEAAASVLIRWHGFVENGITLRPESPAFYIVLAHLQQSAGDHDAAIATLRRGLVEIPDGDELAFLIVQQFILTDQIDLAEAELDHFFPKTAGGRTYRETLCGLIAVRRQEFETAKLALQSVVDKGLDDNPFAENVRLQLARCYEALDDWANAASIYEDMLRRNPANETARLGLAVARLAMGRHEEGVAELKSLSHLDGVLQHFVLLEAETTARKPEEIRDWAPLQKFLEKKSANVEPGEAAWLRALIAVAQRDLGTASIELKSNGLEKTDTLFDLALVVYSNREVPLELLEKIVDAEPDDVPAASAVLAAWAQGDFRRVSDFVTDRLESLPRKERLLEQSRVASICQQAGELIERDESKPAKRLFDQAEALRQLVEMDPLAKTALVEFLVARGRAEEATAICELAFGEGSVEFAVLWLDAAQTHRDSAATLAQLESALKTAVEPSLTPAASTDSTRGELQLVLADLFTLTERYAEAETTYRRVLREAPGHPVVKNNLAWLLAMQNRRLPEALDLIEATIAERGSVPQLLDTRGCVRLALGEDDEARLDFEMSVTLEPSPDALFHLAVAELRLDDEEAARRAMRRAEEFGFRMEYALPFEQELVREVRAISTPNSPRQKKARQPDRETSK